MEIRSHDSLSRSFHAAAAASRIEEEEEDFETILNNRSD